MKKFIFSLVVMMATIFSANAQNYATSNYVGSSKFTDNWSITLQAGALTTAENFCAGHTAMAPIVGLGMDKYVNKWLGFGFDGRVLIGTGNAGENSSRFNSKAAIDALNVSVYTKINVLNIFSYNGERKMFEPVVYGGLGWGHAFGDNVSSVSESDNQMVRNCLTARVGCEFNFNLGKSKAWAIVVNPSVVWGNVNNMRLMKKNCDIELTAGIVYHFKTSNGTHGFAKAKLYDQAEVDRLNARIAELEQQPTKIVEKIVKVPETAKAAGTMTGTCYVTFEQGSAELSEAAKVVLNGVGQDAIVNVMGSTSPEGSSVVNAKLAEARAQAVADYLTNRGVKVLSSTGGAAGRMAVITISK